MGVTFRQAAAQIDHNRLGLLLLAAAALSRRSYVCVTFVKSPTGAGPSGWTVAVRWGDMEHTTQKAKTILNALDLAVEWLRSKALSEAPPAAS